MARVEFNITITGTGQKLVDAWMDAVYRFSHDCGPFPDEHEAFCEDCEVDACIDDLVDGQLCQKCHLKEENDEHEAS